MLSLQWFCDYRAVDKAALRSLQAEAIEQIVMTILRATRNDSSLTVSRVLELIAGVPACHPDIMAQVNGLKVLLNHKSVTIAALRLQTKIATADTGTIFRMLRCVKELTMEAYLAIQQADASDVAASHLRSLRQAVELLAPAAESNWSVDDVRPWQECLDMSKVPPNRQPASQSTNKSFPSNLPRNCRTRPNRQSQPACSKPHLCEVAVAFLLASPGVSTAQQGDLKSACGDCLLKWASKFEKELQGIALAFVQESWDGSPEMVPELLENYDAVFVPAQALLSDSINLRLNWVE